MSSAFSKYSTNKISALRLKITSTSDATHHLLTSLVLLQHQPLSCSSEQSLNTKLQKLSFRPQTNTAYDLDPVPTSLLKQCLSVLLPTTANIINLSPSSGTFPDQFKHCVIKPLLKKSNLHRESL